MKFDVQLNGLDGVLERLKTLTPKLQRRVLRSAARKAMLPVRDDARERAMQLDDPQTAESIAKNITIQVSTRRSRQVGGVVMRVGVLGGARQYANTRQNVRKRRAGKTYRTLGSKTNPGGDTWYWRFIELGTSRQRAQPFLRPALETRAQQVTDILATEVSQGIDKLISEA